MSTVRCVRLKEIESKQRDLSWETVRAGLKLATQLFVLVCVHAFWAALQICHGLTGIGLQCADVAHSHGRSGS